MRYHLRLLLSGIGAVGTKELRGRMRGWRAFVSLTLYLALLAGFTLLIYLMKRQEAANGSFNFGGTPYSSATVGLAVFEALMLIQTILVVFLAPAYTSGAISLEREKQTLEMLAATPVPSLAIVIGKLVSALAFVLVLILASVPLVAVVFVFGGVAPDDILRGYLVLLVSGLGFGSLGLALSAITRRTQAATVLTWISVLVLTLGTASVFALWNGIARPNDNTALPRPMPVDDVAGGGAFAEPGATTAAQSIPRPPEWLLWLNPGVAMGDVICGAGVDQYSSLECRGVALVLGSNAAPGPVFMERGFGFGGDKMAADAGPARAVAPGIAIDPNAGLTQSRDRLWPQIAVSWLVVSFILLAFSVVMVRPRGGRRFSLPRPHLPRRRSGPPEVTA